MIRVQSNVFKLVLPSNLERVSFLVLSASLCIFSLSHTRNVGRIAIKGSTKLAEVDVSLSLLSQQSSFLIISHVTIVFFFIFCLECFKDCYDTRFQLENTVTVIFTSILNSLAVSERIPCSLRSALTRVYAILSGHPNVVGNRERVCDFGQSLTFSQMYSELKTSRHVLIFY